MAVFFSGAVLLALEGRLTWAAACLGMAVLAKSLVPLVLFLPLIAMALRPIPALVFLGVAVPWHALNYWRNGKEFLWVLFVQQQFGRFTTVERQHVQQWWFYLPVLLMALYPWFPLLPLARFEWKDRRVRMLAYVVLFGFVFFSASRNKLPTYLLPLLPSACALMGIGLARAAQPEKWMLASAALLGAAPAAARILPAALATGIHTAEIPWRELAIGCLTCGGAGAIAILAARRRAVGIIFAGAAAALLWLKVESYPALDAADSARPVWQARHPECISGADRGLDYGLEYYAGRTLDECAVLDPSPGGVVR
jgi:4-amino-4-deoxy-L-arabinose transferase-like glycosyltransferase